MNKLWLVLVSAAVMLGCSHAARLYPVQGPLSAQTPLPVLAAKVTGSLTPGDFSVVLSDGEVCKGHFSVVSRNPTAKTANPATPAAADLSSAWDTIYGPGFYVAHVLGARYYARTVASGNRGTVLNVEIYRSENVEGGTFVAATKGVAKDSGGNLYKIVF